MHACTSPPSARARAPTRRLCPSQSKETEKLIRKNEKLVAENQSLKRELSLHQQTEEEFARKASLRPLFPKGRARLFAKAIDARILLLW